MKSDPILYKDFIATLIEPTGAKGKKVVASKIAEELDLAIKDAAKSSTTPSTSPTPPNSKNDPAEKIQKIFDRLAEATAPLLATDTKVALLAPPKTMSLGGSTVAIGMSIDWLGHDYPKGTATSGGQKALMDLLVTDKNKKSENKYIRGHLLNEELGGRGDDNNLFPITANANSQHLASTESKIKEWKGTKVAKKPTWVFYSVTVNVKDPHLDPQKKDSPENWVDADLVCSAHQKDAEGNKTKEPPISTVIKSIFGEKWKAGSDKIEPKLIRKNGKLVPEV
jgi:hypothetical protein